MEAELIVPGGAEHLAADTALAVVLAQQGGYHATEHPQVLSRGPVLEPTVVLPENDIQHPVQSVFDAPVPPCGAAQLHGAAAPATDVMGHLEGLLVSFPPRAGHAEDGLHIRPLLPGAQPLQVVPYQTHPLL